MRSSFLAGGTIRRGQRLSSQRLPAAPTSYAINVIENMVINVELTTRRWVRVANRAVFHLPRGASRACHRIIDGTSR